MTGTPTVTVRAFTNHDAAASYGPSGGLQQASTGSDYGYGPSSDGTTSGPAWTAPPDNPTPSIAPYAGGSGQFSYPLGQITGEFSFTPLTAGDGYQGTSPVHPIATPATPSDTPPLVNALGTANSGGALVPAVDNLVARADAADNDAVLPVCFPIGTPVHTETGFKSIENVDEADASAVPTDSDFEGSRSRQPFVDFFSHGERPVVGVRVGEQVIRVTPAHPFAVRGRGWVPARSLAAGDPLVSIVPGEVVRCGGVFDNGEVAPVYNLHVANAHTYFVATPDRKLAVLVHNQSGIELLEEEAPKIAEFIEEEAPKLYEAGEGLVVAGVGAAAAAYSYLDDLVAPLLDWMATTPSAPKPGEMPYSNHAESFEKIGNQPPRTTSPLLQESLPTPSPEEAKAIKELSESSQGSAQAAAQAARPQTASGGALKPPRGTRFASEAANSLPNVNKAVNSDIVHASKQAAARGLIADERVAADASRALSKEITTNGLPAGTVRDPGNVIPRTDSVLVPFGNGAAVYEITKNGTAILRTVLSEEQFLAAKAKLGL
ncbi:MAG TPA: Hint domain-containing protein [Pirellulales bacterium]|jgi:hypothetical protein|nr:Hint domain-containing protein [Pirellulales bacterium]